MLRRPPGRADRKRAAKQRNKLVLLCIGRGKERCAWLASLGRWGNNGAGTRSIVPTAPRTDDQNKSVPGDSKNRSGRCRTAGISLGFTASGRRDGRSRSGQ